MTTPIFDRYMTNAEEKKLRSTVQAFADVYARRDSAWMGLLRHTGIRVQSLSLLTVSDAENAVATGRLQVRDEIAKGGHGYSVPVNRKARVYLRVLLKIRREMGFNRIAESALVCSRNRRGLSVRSFQSRMAFWVREAGLFVPASPHWWRHTLAHRILETTQAKDPLGVIQCALGHRSRNSTAMYARPSREDVVMALEGAA